MSLAVNWPLSASLFLRSNSRNLPLKLRFHDEDIAPRA